MDNKTIYTKRHQAFKIFSTPCYQKDTTGISWSIINTQRPTLTDFKATHRMWNRQRHRAAKRCWGPGPSRACPRTAELWMPWGTPWSAPWTTPRRWTACRSPERSIDAWCTPGARRSRSLYILTKSYLQRPHTHTYAEQSKSSMHADNQRRCTNTLITLLILIPRKLDGA